MAALPVSSHICRRDALRGIAATAATIAGPRLAAAEARSMVEERWSAGGLVGTFARPVGDPMRGPAAVILAGSGPNLRDGTFGTYRRIAEGLVAEGIRSVRYDKRGIGESRALVAREDDVILQHFVDDAVTAARDLQARSDVSAVIFIGHSEGALLAILAAAKVKVAGIVLLSGPGRRFDVILGEQIKNLPLPRGQEHVRLETLSILETLAKGERVANVSKQNMILFRPSVQPFLISLIPVDPAAEFGRLTVPALIVQGARDVQIRQTDFEALRKARPDARSLLLPEANHVLTRAPADLSDLAAQIKSYDPNAPLVPELVPALAEFIKSVSPKP
jgi:pimeloyl-ACP methyl ester carboxylesterase